MEIPVEEMPPAPNSLTLVMSVDNLEVIQDIKWASEL
jgi:hypothetical protein